MREKFGGDPTAGSKNLPFKFNNRCSSLGKILEGHYYLAEETAQDRLTWRQHAEAFTQPWETTAA